MSSICLTQNFFDVLDEIELSVAENGTAATVGTERIQAGSEAELRAELSAAIYRNLHIRHSETAAQTPPTGEPELVERLIAEIPHRQVYQPVAALGRQLAETGSPTPVDVAGLMVLIHPEHLVRDAQGTITGAYFPSYRTNTTPGYVLALGEHGPGPGEISRIYISSSSASDTVRYWGPLLRALNATGCGYQAKALSTAASHPRSDAIVLYLPRTDVNAVHLICEEALAGPHRATTPTSIFTEALGGQLATAQEPADPRPAYRGLSFGQHRSRVLAEALLSSARSGTTLRDAWQQAANQARIDPHNPGRNLNR